MIFTLSTVGYIALHTRAVSVASQPFLIRQACKKGTAAFCWTLLSIIVKFKDNYIKYLYKLIFVVFAALFLLVITYEQ